MKYYRYMSITEFIKMTKGEEIVPIQTFENASTGDANGVCFLCEETKFDSYGGMMTLSPEDCYQFLKRHLHDTSILVEFETNIPMKETWGQYSSPLGEYFTDKTPFNPEYSEIKQCYGDDIKINEYRVDSYNVKTLKPTRFSIPQEMTYWNAFKYNLHLSDYDESLPNEIKWFEVGKELNLPKEVEEGLILNDGQLKIFEIPDSFESYRDYRHLIPICHLTNHLEDEISCVITIDEFDGKVTITTNSNDFYLRDELLNRLEDFKLENFDEKKEILKKHFEEEKINWDWMFPTKEDEDDYVNEHFLYGIKKHIDKFGTDYGVSFNLPSLGYDKNHNKIYDKEMLKTIVSMVSNIMENSKKKEIFIGD